ncbi:MAG: hypothetical protein QOG67_3157, partial [Verrucomicrobiota bacterium]
GASKFGSCQMKAETISLAVNETGR